MWLGCIHCVASFPMLRLRSSLNAQDVGPGDDVDLAIRFCCHDGHVQVDDELKTTARLGGKQCEGRFFLKEEKSAVSRRDTSVAWH